MREKLRNIPIVDLPERMSCSMLVLKLAFEGVAIFNSVAATKMLLEGRPGSAAIAAAVGLGPMVMDLVSTKALKSRS